MSDSQELNHIVSLSGCQDAEVLALFRYGSRVYGCFNNNSDYDYILIKDSGAKTEIINGNININVYSRNDFLSNLFDHDISALECFFIDTKHILRLNIGFMFSIEKIKLRHAVSEKASHSFVKAKKKFIVPASQDIYAGKKSLFHSLRIIDFGIQIAKYDTIKDYASVNALHDQIINNPSINWDDYHKIYKPLFNTMMTDFRKLAPKE